MNRDITDGIKDIIPGDRIFRDEPMNRHTTFRTGGKADLFLRIRSSEELSGLLSLFDKNREPYLIIGNGSNLLVSDKGYRGAVLQIMSDMSEVAVERELVIAEAGALLSKVSDFAVRNELSGFEFASGIPGTVGGAMVMNAGAYGGEMKDVTEYVEVMDTDGRLLTLSAAEMGFGYRKSVIRDRGYVVVRAAFRLNNGDGDAIRQRVNELSVMRREKQPLEYPSAGSTFKRPEGHFAGKLIMDAGLAGFTVGGAAVSEKHCGFIVNKGGATSEDIYTLIGEVRRRVYEKFDVELEPEVCMIGEF